MTDPAEKQVTERATLKGELAKASRRFSHLRAVSDLKWAQEKAFLQKAIHEDGKLRECTIESLVGALLQTSTMGLSLNPMLHHVYR